MQDDKDYVVEVAQMFIKGEKESTVKDYVEGLLEQGQITNRVYEVLLKMVDNCFNQPTM
jgi:predicted transcriptional regulator